MDEGTLIDGKYVLARPLGRGGMGAVFEAHNRATGKRCAIKLILEKHLHDDRHRARFFREARASSAADSEHIVQIFDCGTDAQSDTPYIVMELLEGESLDALIERTGPIEPQLAARIALQASAGLARAHAAGIVHRDIKPANLFLADQDLGDVVVKVLDFGLAKARQEADASLTQSGALVGTPSYMSPEQALGDKTVDATADVWSLGVVLYEMLTGALPFAGATAIGLMVKIAQEDVPHVHDRAPWVPPPLANIVQRCLARPRAGRYRDAAGVRDALADFVGDARLTKAWLVDAVPRDRTPQVVVRSRTPRRGRPLWLAGVAIGVVAAVAVPIALSSGEDRPPPPAATPEPPASTRRPTRPKPPPRSAGTRTTGSAVELAPRDAAERTPHDAGADHREPAETPSGRVELPVLPPITLP